MSNYKRIFLLESLINIFLFQFVFILTSCSHKNYTGSINYHFKSNSNSPDYSNLNYWAAHPFKKDPSDEVPLKFKNESKDTSADVFFIYPTTYTDQSMPMGWNADIDNEQLNRKTDNSTILYQASVFNKYCRVFAPRYRQANLQAFFTADRQKGEAALDTAYEDVKAAFIYYLKNYNHGRPIIIASHSQGTRHAGKLLKEFFEGKPLQKQLVCAYVIGLPVFMNYFSQLKPCKDSASTGCFVSWRTFEEGYVSPLIQQEKLKAFVTNPLTWDNGYHLCACQIKQGRYFKKFQ